MVLSPPLESADPALTPKPNTARTPPGSYPGPCGQKLAWRPRLAISDASHLCLVFTYYPLYPHSVVSCVTVLYVHPRPNEALTRPERHPV